MTLKRVVSSSGKLLGTSNPTDLSVEAGLDHRVSPLLLGLCDDDTRPINAMTKTTLAAMEALSSSKGDNSEEVTSLDLLTEHNTTQHNIEDRER